MVLASLDDGGAALFSRSWLLLAMLAATCLACSPRAPSDVLLVVVDTLRADRLGAYGWREPTSPNLDRLAAEGVLFEDMRAQAPQTQPSFASILTGTHPMSHGVRANGLFSLRPGATTLAELLREHGYRTGAVVAGFPLDARFGFAQGFDDYLDEMKSSVSMRGVREHAAVRKRWAGHEMARFESSAEQVTADAVRWLHGVGEEPFFLMVHYFDPHHEYEPPAAFAGRFGHPYSGEVARVDRALGQLLAELEAVGRADTTLVVFNADHGECLGEQGRRLHQQHLSEAAVHVPFVMRLPGVLPAGVRIAGLARSVDVLPTILEILGIRAPPEVQGVSLLPAIERRETDIEIAYFETLWGRLEGGTGKMRQGLSDGRWKLVRERRDAEPGAPAVESFQLYDLRADPEEIRDLAEQRPEELRRLRRRLEAFLDAQPHRRAEVVSPHPQVIQQLKALGYL
jgi:arylsulfatase A-like enzyme